MPDHVKQPQNTLVVRFWWEWQGEGSNQTMGWRGRVEHMQSGEGMTFRDARQLLVFIARFITSFETQAAGDALPEGDHSILNEEVKDTEVKTNGKIHSSHNTD